MRALAIGAFLVAALGLGSIAGGETDAAGAPSATDSSRWLYSCGGFPFRASMFAGPASSQQGKKPRARALRRVTRSRIWGPLPRRHWREVGYANGFVEYVRRRPPSELNYVALYRHRKRWVVSTIGGCHPEPRPKRFSVGDWTLDRTAPLPTPGSTEIHALVSEWQCASGKPPGDRVRRPQVADEPGRIVIVARVRPLGGFQTCPGVPPSRYTFELDEPIGERVVVDGMRLPFSPRLACAEGACQAP